MRGRRFVRWVAAVGCAAFVAGCGGGGEDEGDGIMALRSLTLAHQTNKRWSD
jgi:hypothetical protein